MMKTSEETLRGFIPLLPEIPDELLQSRPLRKRFRAFIRRKVGPTR
jgi:hypothetical protein